MELPPDETGRVPVQHRRAEPRYYGVTPTTFVLVLAAAAVTLAAVLLALGHWPFGLIALGVGILLIVVFVEATRRRPDGVARSTAEALKHEKFLFLAHAGAYATSANPRVLLAERIEALVTNENTKWISHQQEAAAPAQGSDETS